jgi:signal transduction histidine kinase
MVIALMRFSGTARRLLFAFVSLFLIFGAAAYFAMAGLVEVHDLLHGVKRHESSVRSALELASAVRDQYAHQAHTIILGNDTHLGFYETSRRRVLELTKQVNAHATSEEEHRWIKDIERASAELDSIFRTNIVPAVLAKEHEVILREHARAQDLVSLIQDRADHLATNYERAIGDFEAHAGVVQHDTVRWSLILFVAAMALAIALGVYIGNSVARPVARLEAGAARIAAGDLEIKIDLDTPDEFGRLAQQFNSMTAALKEHQRLRVETEKLTGIGRLAAGVAHEINNPLAVILGYARLLRRKAHGALEVELGIVEDEAIRCQLIVEGLLDLARPIKLERERVAIREICVEAVERLQEAQRLPTDKIEIDGNATIEASAPRLRQVLMNLIQNAAEAAGPSGSVRATIRTEGDGAVVIAVSDTGPGITNEHREKLFEPFFTTKPKGTGLGLAISKAIARAHGGDIEASSSQEGGAMFVVRLPRALGEAG